MQETAQANVAAKQELLNRVENLYNSAKSANNEFDAILITNKVKFLGHGVGLHIDEYPVIANGFNDPLEENMVISIEPKKSFENTGIVGVEDTYLVTKEGGKCITGGEKEIIIV